VHLKREEIIKIRKNQKALLKSEKTRRTEKKQKNLQTSETFPIFFRRSGHPGSGVE
jgi:hypothetical protein